ncbi:cyclase family protein [Nocardiopsis lucentensis]|uniref:cyclase family protein n=1 Tax=Nocardiopsis lucentensis TaxID=53441 RepID=UPI00034736FF|nr:cyclase family protein [Nocardiopsis lucentensis]
MCGPELIRNAQSSLAKDSADTATMTAPRPTTPEPATPARPASAGVGRRRMLTGSAAVGALLTGIGALGVGNSDPAYAQALNGVSASRLRVTNLSHAIHTDFPVYSPFALEPNIFQTAWVDDDGYNALKLEIDEHTGTHMDAPWHFFDNDDALRNEQMDPANLVCPLVVIRIADRAETDLDAEVTVRDLRNWERRYGRIPRRALIAMDSGWTRRVLSGQADMLNRGSDGIPHFPGFSAEACAWLLNHRDVAGIAVDSPSLDPGPKSVSDPQAHILMLGANKYGLEITAHMDEAPECGAIAVVGVINTKGGTGGPTRLLAVH